MLAESCVPVATHRHGCCVLQRALDASTPDQARLLITQVCTHALQLMQVSGRESRRLSAVFCFLFFAQYFAAVFYFFRGNGI